MRQDSTVMNSLDHVASDGLDAILELSREEHEMNETQEYSFKKLRLREKLAELDAEIAKYEHEICTMQARLNHSKGEREKVRKEMTMLCQPAHSGKGKTREEYRIDYKQDEFEWIGSLKAKMKEVFNINNFRLCQEGACNANMDGRDIVCVMPTGGGKSLTYQLPALLQPGCTLVISPLLSLITDQILHLTKYGVKAVKITGGTSKQESARISSRLHDMAVAGKLRPNDEIKLCYVTPEKIAKSKTFLSTLQILANARRLARIVVDEAHCVSQLGHDFRPDYQHLHKLRQLFPHVPIMALSATCPPHVLEDLIKTLGLSKEIVDGSNATPQGTVHFTAPLYRKNLHYSVVPKPGTADVLQAMVDYILKHHSDDSGIVYCLSKKDCEKVAQGLSETGIKTGVYHSDRSDLEKEQVHIAWRKGSIKVVCATIAFGLGIDKGDVRFVLHHSLSKSLDGFYQESGRAGRDGKDSDCVLYYRPQDGITMSSMVSHEKEGEYKLRAMLKFAQDLRECRNTQFAKYFSHSSQLAMSSWTTRDSDVLSPCNHCDNCQRDPEDVEERDVTFQAWQLLKITEALNNDGASVTLNQLVKLARGNGGGTYEVRKRGGRVERRTLDLKTVAGGKVDLTKGEIERLVVDLLLQQYLTEKYQATTHCSTNVYLIRGSLAPRLTSHTQDSLRNATEIKVECVFQKNSRKAKASAKAPSSSRKPANTSGKRKRMVSESEHVDRENTDIEDVEDDDDDVEIAIGHAGPSKPRPEPRPDTRPRLFAYELDSDDSNDFNDDWECLTRVTKGPPPSKKPRSSRAKSPVAGRFITENNREVLVLSD